MSALTYAGKRFRLTVDNGDVFHITYAPDGTKLHWEAAGGPANGASEDVDVHAAEIVAGVFLVGWTEKTGTTVSHVMNLNTNTVHAYWTYATPAGQVGELHTGILEAL